MTIRVGLLCLLAGALVLAPSFARATAPGSNGKIAFYRYRLQDNPLWSEIYVANQDGSGEHRVSHSARAVEDKHAHWSPDGKLIVFDRCTQIVVHPGGQARRHGATFAHTRLQGCRAAAGLPGQQPSLLCA